LTKSIKKHTILLKDNVKSIKKHYEYILGGKDMEIRGIDIGNFTTITDNEVLFLSRVENGHNDINKDAIKVVYKDEKYTIGSKKGTKNIGENKYFNKYYDLCLLTAIAESSEEVEIKTKIVVSLPPEQYDSKLKNKLLDKLKKLGKQEIIVNGVKKTITIEDALVFSEAAIVFSDMNQFSDKKTLVIDIGGGTGDVSEFNGLELVNHMTSKNGTLSYYKDMKQKINHEYSTNFDIEEMEDFINKDTYKIRGEYKDISFLKDTVDTRTMNFVSDINQNFNTSSTDIYLIGGGAKDLIKYFKKYYPNIVAYEKAQYINAITNKKVGVVYFGDNSKKND
jgi:plasmid segregation protein ParM